MGMPWDEMYCIADLIDFFNILFRITDGGVEVFVRSVFNEGLRTWWPWYD